MKKIFTILLALFLTSDAFAQVSCSGPWTDNPRGPYCNLSPQRSGINIGSASNPFGTIYGTIVSPSSTFTDITVTDDATVGDDLTVTGTTQSGNVTLTDGSDKNYTLTSYAAGTAYSLTNTAAALDFGTTDPSVTINKAGTYSIRGKVRLNYTGATFAASRTVTIKFRRTNNTAADLTNGTEVVLTAIVTTVTATFMEVVLPEVIYTTTNTDDVVKLFGDVNTVPSAGTLDAAAASIVVSRLY